MNAQPSQGLKILPPFFESRTAFVILTWNSERFVKGCVESVLALDCSKLDVFVVDNGSSDGTLGILNTLEGRDFRLHVLRERCNRGTTKSRNRALRLIDSEVDYVCVLDSDTVVNQDSFVLMADILRRDSNIGVVGPTMASSNGEVQMSGRNLPTLGIKVGKALGLPQASESERPDTPIVGGLQDVGYLLSACWLMPRSTIECVGYLDEKIFYAPEDADWCLRCHACGFRVVRCYDAQIIHEYQRLSHQRLFSRTNLEHVKGLLYYFRKHGCFFRAPSFDDNRR